MKTAYIIIKGWEGEREGGWTERKEEWSEQYRPLAISQTYEAAYPVYILLDVFIYTDVNEGKEEAALRCCKTEHYYPSSPLPRTLRRPGNRLEEDAIAKTKNPGNYGQGPLTPTLPPFNLRRDLSPDSWFSTSISRSNAPIERRPSLLPFRYSRVSALPPILISLFFPSITRIIPSPC